MKPDAPRAISKRNNRYIDSISLLSIVTVFLLMCVVTYYYLLDPYKEFIGVSQVNFLFHEFGHIITQPFPFLIVAMGGTIFQLGIPLLSSFYFFFQKRYLESALFLCWLGTNLSYVGIYMKDTILRTMPMSMLFGPDAIHDWEYIFREFGVELYALEIGETVLRSSQFIMLFACIYVGYLLISKCLIKIQKGRSLVGE